MRKSDVVQTQVDAVRAALRAAMCGHSKPSLQHRGKRLTHIRKANRRTQAPARTDPREC